MIAKSGCLREAVPSHLRVSIWLDSRDAATASRRDPQRPILVERNRTDHHQVNVARGFLLAAGHRTINKGNADTGRKRGESSLEHLKYTGGFASKARSSGIPNAPDWPGKTPDYPQLSA